MYNSDHLVMKKQDQQQKIAQSETVRTVPR
jgi:hypothetical protein